jgi:hypothetical protein
LSNVWRGMTSNGGDFEFPGEEEEGEQADVGREGGEESHPCWSASTKPIT